ncbi:MAG: hypothetical protein ACE14P_00805 [Methanotrichaceae archaeon]
METMGDLLGNVREFGSRGSRKEDAQKLFSWGVQDVVARTPVAGEAGVAIVFDNGLIIYARYFLNLDPTESEDNCEFILALRNDLRSRIRYNVFYSGYIHGQGYIRVKIAETDNRTVQRMLEDLYVPALKNIYKPIISQFKGFYSKDYFGVEADNNHGEIYYSPVRYRSEHKDAKIWDVVGKLHELDAMMREGDIRHALAELDVQMSFLPSVMWSDI